MLQNYEMLKLPLAITGTGQALVPEGRDSSVPLMYESQIGLQLFSLCSSAGIAPNLCCLPCILCQGSCNKVLSFVFSSVVSEMKRHPNSPFAKLLSKVAILLVRIRDILRKPLEESG